MRASAFALSLLALGGCGEPPRGAGVHELTSGERIAQGDAEFLVGEQLGTDALQRRLLALGVRPGEIERAIDEDYRIELVRLAIGPDRLAQLDGPALARLQLDSNYRIAFVDPATERAAAEYIGEERFRRDNARAIAELKDHGDWQRVPRRRGLEPIPRFARRLESWCDYDPEEALQVIDGAWLAYTPEYTSDAVREAVPGRNAARFDCLRRAVYAIELRWHFIGNRGAIGRPAA